MIRFHLSLLILISGTAVEAQYVQYDYGQAWPPPFYLSPDPDIWMKGGETVSGTLHNARQSYPVMLASPDENGTVFFLDDRAGVNNLLGAKLFNTDANTFGLVKDRNVNADIVLDFTLDEGYPNPVSLNGVGNVTLTFTLQKDDYVTLRIYNSIGELLATIVDGNRPAGRYNVPFNFNSMDRSAASGVYFYTLTVGDRSIKKKLTVLD